MKLTEKDREFLARLRALYEQKALAVDLKNDGCRRMVLRGNYGDKIDREFGMTRQGVRWRFQRLFNEVYVEAYQTIYLVESRFGTGLRPMALEIARERIALRKKAHKMGLPTVYRRKP